MSFSYTSLGTNSRDELLLYIGSQFEEENSQTLEAIDGGYLISAGLPPSPGTALDTTQQGPLERYLSQNAEEDACTASGWT